MNPTPRGGTILLTADEAAPVLGAGPDRVRFLAGRGFLTAIPTDRGPKYREDEVQALADAIAPPPALLSPKITVAQAAYVLHVDTRTVLRASRGGLLTRDARGLYDSAEVRALHASRRGRKALKPAPSETT